MLSQPMARETSSRGRPAASKPAVCPLAAAAAAAERIVVGLGRGGWGEVNHHQGAGCGPAYHSRVSAWSRTGRKGMGAAVMRCWRVSVRVGHALYVHCCCSAPGHMIRVLCTAVLVCNLGVCEYHHIIIITSRVASIIDRREGKKKPSHPNSQLYTTTQYTQTYLLWYYDLSRNL